MNSIVWRSRHAIAAKWSHAAEATPSAELLLKKTAIECGCGQQLCVFTISPQVACVCATGSCLAHPLLSCAVNHEVLENFKK